MAAVTAAIWHFLTPSDPVIQSDGTSRFRKPAPLDTPFELPTGVLPATDRSQSRPISNASSAAKDPLAQHNLPDAPLLPTNLLNQAAPGVGGTPFFRLFDDYGNLNRSAFGKAGYSDDQIASIATIFSESIDRMKLTESNIASVQFTESNELVISFPEAPEEGEAIRRELRARLSETVDDRALDMIVPTTPFPAWFHGWFSKPSSLMVRVDDIDSGHDTKIEVLRSGYLPNGSDTTGSNTVSVGQFIARYGHLFLTDQDD